MQATIDVLEFPHKLSLRILVNLLSRKGICWGGKFVNIFIFFPFLLSNANAAMQLPNEDIDLLIFLASSNLRPFEEVLDSLSLPAKSTIVSNPFY